MDHFFGACSSDKISILKLAKSNYLTSISAATGQRVRSDEKRLIDEDVRRSIVEHVQVEHVQVEHVRREKVDPIFRDMLWSVISLGCNGYHALRFWNGIICREKAVPGFSRDARTTLPQ